MVMTTYGKAVWDYSDSFTELKGRIMTDKLQGMEINNWRVEYFENRAFHGFELTILMRLLAYNNKVNQIIVNRKIDIISTTEAGSILATEQEIAFRDLVGMIQCGKTTDNKVRLCKSLHILSNRICFSQGCKLFK